MNKIIVLIPHYNNISDLKKTLASISETIAVDVLVVDDGSKQAPKYDDILSSFSNKGNLYLEVLPKNVGIEKALNYGLKIIIEKKHPYIGRLDVGDLAHQGKFEKQLNYLEQNKDVYLLGSWANIVDESYRFQFVLKHPTEYHDIKNKMFYNNCFVHPSVVFRSEVIHTIGYYPENRKYAEDFAYFFLITNQLKVQNLPEPLLDYVIAPNSISSQKRKEQIKSRIKIIQDHFYFGFYPITGYLRNLIIQFISRNTINKIKKTFKL